MTRQFILIFIQSLIFIPLFGQSNNAKIYIFNGSFEGTPRCCTPPDGWIEVFEVKRLLIFNLSNLHWNHYMVLQKKPMMVRLI